jgi:hypothetical protein
MSKFHANVDWTSHRCPPQLDLSASPIYDNILEADSGKIFCVSKCDDRGSMWDYWKAERLMASKTADVPHSAT